VNVVHSTTPKGEKPTDNSLKACWENFNWQIAQEYVNRLQSRITKATLKQNWNLVKRLQHLLTHSFSAKMIATQTVSKNKGKRTAGIDGKIWTTPETKMAAAISLSSKNYKAQPLRRVYIDKYGKKEKRPLSIPTMHDRAMQALYALALSPVAEATADKRSFGFRKYRSTQDACEQTFTCLCRNYSAQWILEGDIRGCFDNISHTWLLNNIPLDKCILSQFLKAGFSFHQTHYPTESGTPQGGIISPLLANMTLDGIETAIGVKYYAQKCGKIDKANYNFKKVNFVRYADDFIVTADSEETAREIKELIGTFLKERGLSLSEEKTRITHINDGFDFLGWNFRKYRGKLIVKPSKKSIDKVIDKIRAVIKEGRAWTQDYLIGYLNPIITGWTNYHRSVSSAQTFSRLDHVIWEMLWTWTKRRHHNKSHTWIVDKYWHKHGTRKWIFSSKDCQLRNFSDTKIRRHTLVKLDKNPYLDSDYFAKRRLFLDKRYC